MPFTLSHPAIVLPFKKFLPRYFFLSVAIIGSMAPDFEYFVRLRAFGNFGHTLLGVFLLDVPATFLVWLVWEKIIKKPLLTFFPSPFDRKFVQFRDMQLRFSWFNCFIFITSALVGIFSHIFWDFFTHGSSDLLATFPSLVNSVLFSGHSIKIYKLLQYGSSVAGVAALMCTVLFYPRRPLLENNYTFARPKEKLFFWLLYFTLALFVFVSLFTTRISFPYTFGLVSLTITLVSSLFLSLLFSTVLYTLRILKIKTDHINP